MIKLAKDKNTKNVAAWTGGGALAGVVAGIIAKKLINGDKPLTAADVGLWGGGGALIGGLGGAGIAAQSSDLPDHAIAEMKKKREELKAKIDKADSWGSMILENAGWGLAGAGGGGLAGDLAQRWKNARWHGHRRYADARDAALKAGKEFKHVNRDSRQLLADFGEPLNKHIGAKIGALLGLVASSLYTVPDMVKRTPKLWRGSREAYEAQLEQLNEDLEAAK